jgi:peptide/nickel transport system permease protein
MREISLPLPWSTVGKISVRLQVVTRGVGRLIKEKPLGAFGGVIVLGLLLCALLAPWIATHPYDQTNVRNRLKPPGAQFYFGTDNLGRDIFSRIVYGARVSVTVGFGAVSIGICLATLIGVGSGYVGGKADVLVQRLVDAQMAIPGLLLLLNIMAVLGQGC